MLNSTKIKKGILGSAKHASHFGMAAIVFNISPNAQKCPLSVFTFYPSIDRSRCLNLSQGKFTKGSFEQF